MIRITIPASELLAEGKSWVTGQVAVDFSCLPVMNEPFEVTFDPPVYTSNDNHLVLVFPFWPPNREMPR